MEPNRIEAIYGGFEIRSACEDGIYYRWGDGGQVGMLRPHVHPVNEMMLVESGCSTITVGNSVTHVKAPYVVFYPQYLPHMQNNSSDGEQAYCRSLVRFNERCLQGLLPTAQIPRQLVLLELSAAELALVKPYMDLIGVLGQDETRETRCAHLIAIILQELDPLIRRNGQHENVSRSRALVQDVCIHINENYASTLRIDDIARHFFISRTKLIRLFSEVLGMTVGEYITNVRLGQAKLLLKSGRSVQETALACGFSMADYFIKVFRRRVGTTPLKYSKSLSALTEE